jgi:hypothetical protein
MIPDDNEDFPLQDRILARRTGTQVHDVAALRSQGRTHELFRRRLSGEAALAIVRAWSDVFDWRDAEQSRKRLRDILGRRD